jgi:hypothetical protein
VCVREPGGGLPLVGLSASPPGMPGQVRAPLSANAVQQKSHTTGSVLCVGGTKDLARFVFAMPTRSSSGRGLAAFFLGGHACWGLARGHTAMLGFLYLQGLELAKPLFSIADLYLQSLYLQSSSERGSAVS